MIKKSIILIVILSLILIYTSSLIGVQPKAKAYLQLLKSELQEKGYDSSYFIISGRRFALDNWILNQFGGAASKSRHLKGEAIDIIVLDVNRDGKCDQGDVDIVYKILHRKIIKNKGGIGTYKNQKGFFNRQMVHFDCRGKKARWHR